MSKKTLSTTSIVTFNKFGSIDGYTTSCECYFAAFLDVQEIHGDNKCHHDKKSWLDVADFGKIWTKDWKSRFGVKSACKHLSSRQWTKCNKPVLITGVVMCLLYFTGIESSNWEHWLLLCGPVVVP